MSSREKYKIVSHSQIVQNLQGENKKVNNMKDYKINKVITQKIISSSSINGDNYIQNDATPNRISQYKIKTKFPVNIDQAQNKSIYQSKDIKVNEYSSGSINNMNMINLKHHPNQINDLIHNHKYYASTITKKEKVSKISQSENRAKSVKSIRTENMSPVRKSKYVVETKKVELFSKPRYSSLSNSSRETNVSLSKTQLKSLMADMWLEEIYCSNVESLCCLVNRNNIQTDDNSIEIYEKELEQKTLIIKDYESEIRKLQILLNNKEQEMKKLIENLKQSESALKLQNKKLYELNIKTAKNNEIFDKDTHELQIISVKQEKNTNKNLYKDAHSLEIISLKNHWNDIIVPSPVNEIYIQTVVNAEEMRRIQIRKEEEIRRKQYEKISNYEFQEMGTLSIITKKPKKINLCQRLESIMIISKENISPLQPQKIDKINIRTNCIKAKNEIQELNGLEVIQIKKSKKIKLQPQRLNGLEIHRDYDMLLVKPVWNSLKIQGTGFNLLSIPRDIELENQEIDEFEIKGTKPENIKVLMPIPENNIEKITNFELIGKVNIKPDYKIKKERIKLEAIKKEEINWNDIIKPTKTSKFLLRRNYQKIEPKKEIDWNQLLKTTKTKFSIKGIMKKEEPKKVEILKIVKKDKINYIYSIPEKKQIKMRVERFKINLLAPKKELKKVSLIKNRVDTINIFGLKKINNIFPYSTHNINLIAKEKKPIKNWKDIIKVIKIKELIIPKKIKIENKISKKVVNVEIKMKNMKILKPIKTNKFLIKGEEKEIIKKPILKQIKENKLFIRGIKRVVEKQITKKINWNDLIKIEKNSKINLIHKPGKINYQKQILNSFGLKGIEQIQKKPSEKIIITYNWSDKIQSQINDKFIIQGKMKEVKLLIVKGDQFMFKREREPEEELIYNDDYNNLSQKKKENGNEKMIVIKEKEITPMMKREIRAQVIKVKEESSETSSLSDIDILAGITRQGMMTISAEKNIKNMGYSKKVINGEVIFTKKSNLGVNLGASKYKKEIIAKKGIILNKKETEKITGIEITGSNGQVYQERMSGIGGAIKEGSYKLINGSMTCSDDQKKLTTISNSSVNIRKSNKTTKLPIDVKQNNTKKQVIIRKKLKMENMNEAVNYERFNTGGMISNSILNEGNKKIIYKPNVTIESKNHSSSSYGIKQGTEKLIFMKKEESHVYEQGNDDNLNNANH